MPATLTPNEGSGGWICPRKEIVNDAMIVETPDLLAAKWAVRPGEQGLFDR
jgi:hypothetical protein